MDSKLIKDILARSMSNDHVYIINKLSEPKRDEEIATELNMKETTVRTLLNDLHGEGLVDYKRTKNKKTGWYTYTWNKRDEKISNYVVDHLSLELQKLNDRLDREENGTILACSCSRIPLSEAMELDFLCPECNEPFQMHDNSKELEGIRREIDSIKEILQTKGDYGIKGVV